MRGNIPDLNLHLHAFFPGASPLDGFDGESAPGQQGINVPAYV